MLEILVWALFVCQIVSPGALLLGLPGAHSKIWNHLLVIFFVTLVPVHHAKHM